MPPFRPARRSSALHGCNKIVIIFCAALLTFTAGEVGGVPQDPTAEGSSPTRVPAKNATAEGAAAQGKALYRHYCQRCHDQDGRGTGTRAGTRAIPDFTRAAWQEQRSDAQLLVSILDGKGTRMPSFSERLTREQIQEVTAYLRTLAPAGTGSRRESPSDFDARFRELKDEWQALRRQFHQLAATPADR